MTTPSIVSTLQRVWISSVALLLTFTCDMVVAELSFDGDRRHIHIPLASAFALVE